MTRLIDMTSRELHGLQHRVEAFLDAMDQEEMPPAEWLHAVTVAEEVEYEIDRRYYIEYNGKRGIVE